jgi:hypothetical protein
MPCAIESIAEAVKRKEKKKKTRVLLYKINKQTQFANQESTRIIHFEITQPSFHLVNPNPPSCVCACVCVCLALYSNAHVAKTHLQVAQASSPHFAAVAGAQKFGPRRHPAQSHHI